MTTLTEIQALIDKQLEGVKEQRRKSCHPYGVHYASEGRAIKIISLQQRLGKWVQHESDCKSVIDPYTCTCGLSAELEAIKKELEQLILCCGVGIDGSLPSYADRWRNWVRFPAVAPKFKELP